MLARRRGRVGSASAFAFVGFMKPLFIALFTLSLCSCHSDEAPVQKQYGEAVGVSMQASGSVPAFEMTMAVTQGKDITPLVPALSGTLHQAVASCPDFIKASSSGNFSTLAFTISSGQIKSLQVSGAHPDPCLGKSLQDKPISSQENLDVIVMIRFPSGQGKAKTP